MLYYLSAFTQVFIALIAGYFKDRFERMKESPKILILILVWCLPPATFFIGITIERNFFTKPCEHNIDWGVYENTQELQRV